MDLRRLYGFFLEHHRICTDSRNVQPGDLFFALKGDRFDGNLFAALALEKGAALVVVDNPEVVKNDTQYFLTANVLETLQALGRYHRRQFHIPVIAITGSNGKTTTKELVAAVMGSHYPTHFTKGNLNNHIGVPLTLLALDPGIEVAIVEMGANHQGEIDQLCRIAEPTHGLITNIGKAHLEGFGGIEGVKKGKSELYRYLAETGGVAFINLDEPFLEQLAEPVAKKVTYHRSEDPDPLHKPYEALLIATHPVIETAFLNESGGLTHIKSRLAGKHNFNNIMTAIAIGKYFKVPSDRIKKAIEDYIPSNNRSQLLPYGKHTIYLDAYNANPSSMAEALASFHRMESGRKMAILGDMLELGDSGPAEHQRIGELAHSFHFDELVFVGPQFAAIAHSLGLRHFDAAEDCKTWFKNGDWPPSLILLKGSRGMGLEKVVALN